MRFLPPRSAFGLIQEDLVPNEWLILASCVMLNCTTRRQLDGIMQEFSARWDSPEKLLAATDDQITNVIKSLGFARRRMGTLRALARALTDGGWKHARELPGIGAYGAAAWEMFCRGIIGEHPPVDHALIRYHGWIQQRSHVV